MKNTLLFALILSPLAASAAGQYECHFTISNAGKVKGTLVVTAQEVGMATGRLGTLQLSKALGKTVDAVFDGNMISGGDLGTSSIDGTISIETTIHRFGKVNVSTDQVASVADLGDVEIDSTATDQNYTVDQKCDFAE